MTPALPLVAATLLAWVSPHGAPGPEVTSTLGTRVVFHGWSPDGRFVAYTRVKTLRPRRAGQPPRVSTRPSHRKVAGDRLTAGAPAFGRDLAAWSRAHQYRDEPAARSRVDDRTTTFTAPEGAYEFRVEVADRLYWELTYQGASLVRRPFDTLYVAVDAHLHLAPDRAHAVLVLHLDTGWAVEAAVFPLPLPEQVRERWSESESAASR